MTRQPWCLSVPRNGGLPLPGRRERSRGGPYTQRAARFEQEHLRIFIMNTKNRLLRIHEQYIGNLNGCNVRIGELFREAIRQNAAACRHCCDAHGMD